MFGLSFGELVVFLVLLAIILGAGKVSHLGESVGAFVAGYRRGSRDDDPGIRVRERRADDDAGPGSHA